MKINEGFASRSRAVQLVLIPQEIEPVGQGVLENIHRRYRRVYPVVQISQPKDGIVILEERIVQFVQESFADSARPGQLFAQGGNI